jgi:hypothetical protein
MTVTAQAGSLQVLVELKSENINPRQRNAKILYKQWTITLHKRKKSIRIKIMVENVLIASLFVLTG